MKVHLNSVPGNLFSTELGQPIQSGKSFQEHLKNALNEVNSLQHETDVAFERLIAGDIEFHDAMIVAEKANLALQLTMAIRTKLLESYQEIMRMQV